MITVEKEWEKFAEKAVPKDAPLKQKIEMKRCFYAGAHILLETATGVACSEPEEKAERYCLV